MKTRPGLSVAVHISAFTLVALVAFSGCGSETPPPPINTAPPQCNISSPSNGQTFKPGTTISFKGTVSDSQDRDPTTLKDVAWIINGSAGSQTVPGTVAASGDVVGSVSGLEEGSYTIKLQATDSGRQTGQATVTISMLNHAPTLSSVAVKPAQVDPGAQVLFSGTSGSAKDEDPDDPPQSLRISLEDSLGVLYSSTHPAPDGSWSISATFATGGLHTVFAKVTDTGGAFGKSSPLQVLVNECTTEDADADGISSCDGDCNDQDPFVNPDAAEVCGNSIDDDCDGLTDTGVDQDKDGRDACDAVAPDCNDKDASTYPGATETCNGVDNNCDGTVPDVERDQDADGYRPCNGDCDDFNIKTFPGAVEQCDAKDNDCNTLLPTGEQDLDKDGSLACSGDCNDNDDTVYPGSIELCSDGKDNNCNGKIDEDEDGDKDTYRTCGTTPDCNDADPKIYPGAAEGPDADKDTIADCDGIDNDCDGVIDNDTSCRDDDGDGYVELKNGYNGLKGGDCDDYNPYTFPSAIERTDQQDNNCDGQKEGILSLSNAHVRLWGDLNSGVVGGALSAGNDVNGDGVGDLLIGGSGYDVIYQPSQNRGSAFLLFGKKTGWTSMEQTRLIDSSTILYEDEPSARAGLAVTMAGDLNNDGYGDFSVGAPYHSVSGFENVGQAYIIFGKSAGWGKTTLTSASLATVAGLAGVPDSTNILVGFSMAGGNTFGGGDLNGDGFDDLVIGAPWTTQPGSTGWLMIVPGTYSGWQAKIKPTQLCRIQGPQNHGIGTSVAMAGFVGADGIVDLMVGSSYDVATSAGSSFYVAGDPSYKANAQITLANKPEYYGTTAFDYVGDSVSGQTDIDHDGYDEVFIGRKNAGATQNLAYAIFGGDIMPSTGSIDARASIRFTAGADKLDECPCRVTGIGDMNGDGLGDFAIGVSRNDDSGKDAGKIYIFHGRATRAAWGLNSTTTQIDLPLDNADMAVVGEFADDQAGAAMSGGDINADGYQDLIIGAPRWDGTNTINAGKIYVIFGAPYGHNSRPTK